eukprot:9494411-Pyramimonas_sp.AAC.1
MAGGLDLGCLCAGGLAFGSVYTESPAAALAAVPALARSRGLRRRVPDKSRARDRTAGVHGDVELD